MFLWYSQNPAILLKITKIIAKVTSLTECRPLFALAVIWKKRAGILIRGFVSTQRTGKTEMKAPCLKMKAKLAILFLLEQAFAGAFLKGISDKVQ